MDTSTRFSTSAERKTARDSKVVLHRHGLQGRDEINGGKLWLGPPDLRASRRATSSRCPLFRKMLSSKGSLVTKPLVHVFSQHHGVRRGNRHRLTRSVQALCTWTARCRRGERLDGGSHLPASNRHANFDSQASLALGCSRIHVPSVTFQVTLSFGRLWHRRCLKQF